MRCCEEGNQEIEEFAREGCYHPVSRSGQVIYRWMSESDKKWCIKTSYFYMESHCVQSVDEIRVIEKFIL